MNTCAPFLTWPPAPSAAAGRKETANLFRATCPNFADVAKSDQLVGQPSGVPVFVCLGRLSTVEGAVKPRPSFGKTERCSLAPPRKLAGESGQRDLGEVRGRKGSPSDSRGFPSGAWHGERKPGHSPLDLSPVGRCHADLGGGEGVTGQEKGQHTQDTL